MQNILIIDDSDATYTFCQEFLSDQFKFYHLRSALTLDKYLKGNEIDLILLDKNFQELSDDELVGPKREKHNEGFYILERIKTIDDSIPVIMLTSYADLDSANRAINLGAYDFIESEMLSRGEFLLKNRILNTLKESKEDLSEFIGKFRELGMVGFGPAAIKLYKKIDRAALNDYPVLLLGQTGVGKDKTAMAIHKLSVRRHNRFINCNLPERSTSLIESELFGVEKKVATGVEARMGYFEAVSGGTLLLNEIGDFPLDLQAKLLRVLEEKSIYRVGGSAPIKTDFRLICATNRDLKREVEDGRFREDLYYRINNVSIEIPPLSDRIEDIPPLVHWIIGDYCREMGVERPEISDKAMEALQSREWFGNIRELKNEVEHLINIGNGVITLGTLASRSSVGVGSKIHSPRNLSMYLDGKTLSDLERDIIEFNFRKYGGDVDRIARAIGISRSKLYERLSQYGLR